MKKSIWHDISAATNLEFGAISALVFLGLLMGYSLVGEHLSDAFVSVSTTLETALTGAPPSNRIAHDDDVRTGSIGK